MRAWWNRRRQERELEEELRAHLDIDADELMDNGLPPDAARDAAQRRLGRVLAIKDATRDAWGWGPWDRLAQDLRAAWRGLRRHPTFTLVAVLSLALGIGANTAIFSLVDALALRKLPVQDPDRLVRIVHAGTRGVSGGSNHALLRTLQERSTVFSSLCQSDLDNFKVRRGSQVEIVFGQAVSGDFFATLGVPALIGRTLTAADISGPVPNPVVVLGYDYWRRAFNSDPAALGRTLVINSTPHTIVGVTPPSFFGIELGWTTDLIVPLAPPAEDDRTTWLGRPLIARLKPGVTMEQATRQIDAIFQPFMAGVPGLSADDIDQRWRHLRADPAAGGIGSLRRQFAEPLLLLSGIVALVLLLACANLAGLLLARGVARQRELAIRAALGAGRWRLARLLALESLLLASLGAIAGVLLAWIATSGLLAWLPPDGDVRLTLTIAPNPRLLAFAVAIALLTGALLGAAPVLQLLRGRLRPALEAGGRAVTPARLGAGRALVVAQVAISLVLVVGGLLLARSLRNLQTIDPGFVRDGVLLFTVDIAGTDYDYPRLLAFNRDLLARLRALPGVELATSATITPLDGSDEIRRLTVPGYAPAGRNEPPPHFDYVSGRFFDVFGIPLLRGRAIRDEDDARAPGVAVVSARFATQYFGDRDPIGRVLLAGGSQKRLTIVGVAGDIRHDDLRIEPAPLLYIPVAQHDEAPRMLRYALRVAAGLDPASLMPAARRAARDASAELPVVRMKTLAAEIDERLVRDRLLATLSAFFGLVALLLAAIGLYGLLAYAVARRTGEIGVRIALGATRGGVLWLVARECLALVGAGVVLGLGAAWWATRLLANVLYGLRPTDAATLTAGTALLLGIALAAGLGPARRAARVDPLIALRHE